MNKQQELDRIKADILNDMVCPELAEQATQLVFGEGDSNADMVFIGEAPGRKEDEAGVPFVGASGKFLAEMLASIHLSREQVYITNIVKYRPPQNRDPLPAEKQAFLPYLLRQIEVIKPRLIITLGRHSGMQFLPDLKISSDHGQPKRIRIMLPEKGKAENQQKSGAQAADEKVSEQVTPQSTLVLNILPLYHPAAALYNGSQRQTLLDDFAQIPAIIKKIKETN